MCSYEWKSSAPYFRATSTSAAILCANQSRLGLSNSFLCAHLRWPPTPSPRAYPCPPSSATAVSSWATLCFEVLALLMCLRVEFLLKTDSGYPKDTGVNKPWQPLGIPFAITSIGQLHQFPPSPIPGDLGRGPSHQSTCSNIETRMDRPKSVVRVIRGVA